MHLETTMKTPALTVAVLTALLPSAFAQTAHPPFQIAEIRPGDKVFCEVVVKGGEKDAAVEGYALVVGINSERPLRQIREGVIRDASAKGAELCRSVSGTMNQDRSGGKAVWEMIGLKEQARGDLAGRIAGRHRLQKAVRVKVQLVALAGGTWVEKSRPAEKLLKPPARAEEKRSK